MPGPPDDPRDPPDVVPAGTPCRHFRHNGMYVFTDGSGGIPRDEYDTSNYWCLKTMKGYGPDDDFVGVEDCRHPSRSCYEPS